MRFRGEYGGARLTVGFDYLRDLFKLKLILCLCGFAGIDDLLKQRSINHSHRWVALF